MKRSYFLTENEWIYFAVNIYCTFGLLGCQCHITEIKSDITGYTDKHGVDINALCTSIARLEELPLVFQSKDEQERAAHERVLVYGAKEPYNADEMLAVLGACRWDVRVGMGDVLVTKFIKERVPVDRVLLKRIPVNSKGLMEQRLGWWSHYVIKGDIVGISCQLDNLRLLNVLTDLWARQDAPQRVIRVVNEDGGVSGDAVDDTTNESIRTLQVCGDAVVYWLPELGSAVIDAKDEVSFDLAKGEFSRWQR